jgi:hypothetical protein
MALAYVKLILN